MPNNNAEINPDPNGAEQRDWDELSHDEKVAKVMLLLQPYLPDDGARQLAVLALDNFQLREYGDGELIDHLATGLFLIEVILPLSAAVLYEITSAECIAALEGGQTSLEALAQMSADDIYHSFRVPFQP